MNLRLVDRSFRNLGALQKTASTSRVLNLMAVGNLHGADAEYLAKPFFESRILNTAVILKHRLRGDERYLFTDIRQTATKLIIPFERSDLRLGGQSVFVGQRGWSEMLAELAGSGGDPLRDMALLESLDELPSLDPFLLKEFLCRKGYDIAACYFAISQADLERMGRFVSDEIAELIRLAFVNANGGDTQTARLVEALLSTRTDSRLEPLRLTLKLAEDEWRDGIFSWKGFLYYKWVLSDLFPKLEDVSRELPQLRGTGSRDPEATAYLAAAKARLVNQVRVQQSEIAETLKIYDRAFAMLSKDGKPTAFREFLLSAPELFLSLGERIGVVSHMASFWRYRFPNPRLLAAPLDEAVDILQDFEQSLFPYDLSGRLSA